MVDGCNLNVNKDMVDGCNLNVSGFATFNVFHGYQI
jgi:hypothetical protein